MIVDDIKIKVKSGNGGRGAVAFSKVKMSLGATGGDGGKGGDIYFEGVSDLSTLNQFLYKKELSAEDGENGKGKNHDGADGRDLILRIPVGTVIHNLSLKEDSEIISVGQRLLAAKGGTAAGETSNSGLPPIRVRRNSKKAVSGRNTN